MPWTSLVAVMTILSFAGQPRPADTAPVVYGPNEGAAAYLPLVTHAKGIFGHTDLVSAQPVDSSNDAIVHPIQVDGSGTSDFLGWGTAKGVGVDDCPTYTGSRWQVYVDGVSFGVYFCRQEYGSEPDVANDQKFEVRHTSCDGSTRWAFYWNYALKTCQAFNFAAGMPSAGGEAIGGPQEVDVRYRDMQYRVLGGSWTYWTSTALTWDLGYRVTLIGGSNNDFWVERL
jgi:hypothetical protein